MGARCQHVINHPKHIGRLIGAASHRVERQVSMELVWRRAKSVQVTGTILPAEGLRVPDIAAETVGDVDWESLAACPVKQSSSTPAPMRGPCR